MGAANFGAPGGAHPIEEYARVLSGDFSDEALKAVAQLVAENALPCVAVSILNGLMNHSTAPRDAHFYERKAAIAGIVSTVRFRYESAPNRIGPDGTGPAIVSIADVLTREEPPHEFLWGPYVATHALTLMSAHGGVGKSALALQIAMHVSAGVSFLNVPVVRAMTLYFSAEDSASVVRRRVSHLCRYYGANPEEIDRNLHVLDATDAAVLFEENMRERETRLTETFVALEQYVKAKRIRFLVVDNSSDTFAGNPLDRSQVTRFIRELVRLVRAQGGAVLLLSHVAKATARAGARQINAEGYADSAAWNNAARGRLFLYEDGEQVVLEHQKSNYGPKAEPLRLTRLPGCGFGLADDSRNHRREPRDDSSSVFPILLEMVYEFNARGDWISSSEQSPSTNAHAKLKLEPRFPSLNKAQTMAMFRDMQRKGLIRVEAYQRANRHVGERWALTEAGLALIRRPPDSQ